MRTNGLAKHYGNLTTEERYKMLLAADKRGDDAECARILAASPTRTLKVWDITSFGMGTILAFNWLRIDRLELALKVDHFLFLAECSEQNGDDDQAVRLYDAAKWFAYLSTLHVEADRRLQEETGFQTAWLDAFCPDSVLSIAEKIAADVAFTHDEMLEWKEQNDPDAHPIITVETIIDHWRALRDKFAGELSGSAGKPG